MKAVLEEPRSLGWPKFVNLRNFSEVVPSNPSTFLMESSAPAIVRKENNEIRLPLNFGSKVESAKVFNSSDASWNLVL